MMTKRRPQNKHKAAKAYNRGSSMTHPKNAKIAPLRGGWRL